MKVFTSSRSFSPLIPTLSPPSRRISSSIFSEATPSHSSDSNEVNDIEIGVGFDISQELGDLDQTHSLDPRKTIKADRNKDLTTQSPELEPETAIEKFARYCGISKTGRKYGKFETSGIVANLKFNRFLKRSGVENTGPNKRTSDAAAFTREAFYVVVDDKASATQRDRDVINALPDGAQTTFRVKDIKYGNHNAMWEILSGQLYGLTGLTSPDTRYLVHEDYGDRPDGSPKIFVASPTITGYSDLGDFLIDESIQRFIEPESLHIWSAAKTEIEKINKKSKDGLLVSDADKMKRLRHMDRIYQIMPDYFHTEIEKSFAASKFIANWDFANLNLNNIGCRFTLNREGEVIGFESVFVDFGNSGAIGFKGKYKENSLDHANTEAKNFTESPKDYDPALAFDIEELELILKRAKEINEDELDKGEDSVSSASSTESDSESRWEWEVGSSFEWMKSWIWPDTPPVKTLSTTEKLKKLNLLKQQLKEVAPELITKTLNAISKDLSEQELTSPEQEDLARSIMFKATHHIRPEEAGMGISNVTTGFLTVSDLPRNLPFGFLFRESLLQKTEAASEMHNSSEPLELQKSFYRDSEVEMAFRLSLITDDAIDHVVKKWYLCEEFPTIFPIPEQFKDRPEYTAEGVVKIYKERRDALVRSIPPVIVDDWVAKNQTQALAAQQEVELALLKKTADPSLAFDRKAGSVDTFEKEITINHDNSFAARSLLLVEDRSSQIYPTDVIKTEIRNHAQTIKRDGTKEIESLKEELDSTPEERQLTRGVLQKAIRIKETEVAQKKQESTLDFISANIEKWKKSLGLESNPNCSLFDLNRIREIYRIRNNISPTSNNKILSEEECFEKNEIIHGENNFTYRRVIEIFNTLSLAKQKLDPKTMLSSASSSQLSDATIQFKSLV